MSYLWHVIVTKMRNIRYFVRKLIPSSLDEKPGIPRNIRLTDWNPQFSRKISGISLESPNFACYAYETFAKAEFFFIREKWYRLGIKITTIDFKIKRSTARTPLNTWCYTIAPERSQTLVWILTPVKKFLSAIKKKIQKRRFIGLHGKEVNNLSIPGKSG